MARSFSVKVLLAAITCEKGDVGGNLARHRDVIAEARDAGCDLAVFPEFSLTGSVDPVAHPERAIGLDHVAVQTIAAETHDIAALFGIGERVGDDFFITQALAADGRLVACQRKRRLGHDEEGFSTGAEAMNFTSRGTTFATVICAEGNHDDVWDAATAKLVFYCSAPGLYGRRTTDADWQRGFEWWGEAGLANAERQARRLNLWVGMATQAGSTLDEDFPGIAALIDPLGEIVARLPDWRPGTLIVEIPVSG